MILSIIVPVYQAKNTLCRCADSILSKRDIEFELILVNDGSTDGSQELCDRYAQQDSRVLAVHQPNRGVSAARNRGILEAKGKYLLFVDSDDYVEPDYIQTLLDTAEAYQEKYGHIWCNIQTVLHGYIKKPHFVSEESIQIFDRCDIMTLHELWMDASPCNKLYRKEVISANELIFPEDISLGEDLIFNLKYLDAEKNTGIVILSRTLYNYVREDRESLDNRYIPNLIQIYGRVHQELSDHLTRWEVGEDAWKKFYNICFYNYERILRNTFDKKNRQTSHEKYCENNQILSSQEFQTLLHERTCFVHPAYEKAYQIGKYQLVRILDSLTKLKRSFKRMEEIR